MSAAAPKSVIRLRGVRQNNLKNFDLDLQANQLIVVTGLSGSGKSSLAFDTLYAEGQRRYIETFSPYARQFFDRMDKPQVDSIQGIPPAIALEQRNSVRTTRSTVGTMTEICDYMKAVWPNLAQLHCRTCGRRVKKDSPRQIWDEIRALHGENEVVVAFDLPLSEKLSLKESLELVARQGYQRILVAAPSQPPEFLRLEEAADRDLKSPLTIVQDRLAATAKNRSRFAEACDQAYHFGKGRLTLFFPAGGHPLNFSNRLHCAQCDQEYREPSPALFSFNNPVGACPPCKGFGRIISIDYKLAIPDRSLPIDGGLVKPWQTETGSESQRDLLKACKKKGVPTDVPFQDLDPAIQNWIVEGEPGYGKDSAHEWPRAWYGLKGYFKWLESKAYKMHVRVLLSRYRAYTTCPQCQGKRFQPDSLLFTVNDPHLGKLTLADFYRLPVHRALSFLQGLAHQFSARHKHDPFVVCLSEVCARLQYLAEVGLGYLTLDRPTRTLSGGETERVNLTTCLGSRLVNTLFVLDEPSVGLHARDTARLVGILRRLTSTGNTVVVVEHEPAVMRAADEIVDLGPGHGETGGRIMFQGTYENILRHSDSLTGSWLGGSRKPAPRLPRPIGPQTPRLALSGATLHNLNDFSTEFPLGRFLCVSGVSGSGKSTLVRDILYPLLGARFTQVESRDAAEGDSTGSPELSGGSSSARLSGAEHLSRVIMVDQSALGRTPRSNPAVYIGAFDHLRSLFAESEAALRMGLGPSSFSFNSRDGQCERCRGAGFEKIEMQFLSDIFVRCPDCQGKRFRPHILEARITSPVTRRSWSVADLLDAPVEDTVSFLKELPDSRPAEKALRSLELLVQVGLGYLQGGQPINTLSGGESQRLKLVGCLAEFAAEKKASKPTLFIFDEPTTGLHFEDVRILLEAFQRLVDAGHSLVVVEHNLQVIEAADWILDLGPDAGEQGGQLVFAGTPRDLARDPSSLTAAALRDHWSLAH